MLCRYAKEKHLNLLQHHKIKSKIINFDVQSRSNCVAKRKEKKKKKREQIYTVYTLGLRIYCSILLLPVVVEEEEEEEEKNMRMASFFYSL